ncbi:hypothetical protein PMAYCL1PPCAC_32831, partial [Pristionchus mayeri]
PDERHVGELLYGSPNGLLVAVGHEIALCDTTEREQYRLLAEVQNVRPDLVQRLVPSRHADASDVDDFVRDHTGKVCDWLGIDEEERRLLEQILQSRKVCAKVLLEHLV